MANLLNRKLLTNFFERTNNLLLTTSFTKDEIAKIIKNLNWNKVHGYNISTCKLKICPTYTSERMTLLVKIISVLESILELSGAVVTKTLIVGVNTLSASSHTLILN